MKALQSIWTIQSLQSLETNQCSTSLGRVDQYLYPYFQRDIECGRITAQDAFELFSCFMLKCSEVIWYTPSATAKYFVGYMPFINMCANGIKRHGGDSVNELTYLIMDAVRQIKLYQPTLACRIHNLSPRKYLNKIADVIAAGTGMPACHFDDAHIKMMLRKGYSYEDACDYCLMGCVEEQRSGRVHQWTSGGFTQWPICIDMALHGGVLNSYGDRVWLDSGDTSSFKTYEDFEAAVKRQLDYLIDVNCRGTVIIEKVFRDVSPTPFMSLFVDGCMEKGRDVMDGGAVLYAYQIHRTLSQSFNTPLGEMVGATPDGRAAYAPLSDGMSPSQGMDRNGPTAIIKSVSKINVENMSLGMAHNFKLSPQLIATEEGRNAVIALLSTASLLGNAQMQFNCVDNAELRAAQKKLEEHRDLIVRVAGYSAFFVELCKEVQDEIISRTTIDRN